MPTVMLGRRLQIFTRVTNLLLAVGMVWLSVGLATATGWSLDTAVSVFLLHAACWLAGAIGLFFASRIAWWCSVACVGVVLAYSLSLFWMAWGLMRSQGDHEPSAGYGFTLHTGHLAICVSLLAGAILFGLLQMRRQMSGKQE